jgi:hypothetical protein
MRVVLLDNAFITYALEGWKPVQRFQQKMFSHISGELSCFAIIRTSHGHQGVTNRNKYRK